VSAVNKNISILLLAEKPQENEMAVFVDEDMIQTVLRNLLTNAIKFSYENSAVSIDAGVYHDDNRFLLVSIKDEGIGMSPNSINNLFKIKSMVHSYGTKNETGTGLGLIVVKDFLNKHNCEI